MELFVLKVLVAFPVFIVRLVLEFVLQQLVVPKRCERISSPVVALDEHM